jgi:hypothetical protein
VLSNVIFWGSFGRSSFLPPVQLHPATTWRWRRWRTGMVLNGHLLVRLVSLGRNWDQSASAATRRMPRTGAHRKHLICLGPSVSGTIGRQPTSPRRRTTTTV